jgi:DNA invertase Pin-like site-specific DNA recombinase
MSKNVFIYARVSTTSQSTDSQIQELREYARRRDWPAPQEITDTISGAKSSREGLDRLLKQVRRGQVDCVLVHALDRLARSLSHLVQLTAEFATHKCALIVPGAGIDTSNDSPVGQLQLHILGTVAQFERSLIVGRVNAGLAAARAKGTKLGRRPMRNPHTDAVAQLRSEGLSGRKIAEQLGIGAPLAFKILGQLKAAA